MSTDLKIRKGSIVTVSCCTSMWREATKAEAQKWYQSSDAVGMTSDGETKIFSGVVDTERCEVGKHYIVLRARATAMYCHTRRGKLVEILNPSTGKSGFVNRGLIIVEVF